MKLLYVGTFNPFTIGHQDIVNRALPLCDEMVIAIAKNPNKDISDVIDENYKTLKRLYNNNNKVTIDIIQGLTADYCKKNNINAIVRGIRDIKDFTEERNLAAINKELGVETIFIMANPMYDFVSSSNIRALKNYGIDVSKYLPSII